MPCDLHDVFNDYCHCPTAVTCVTLRRVDQKHKRFINYVIVGDPTSTGAMFNDSFNTGKEPTAFLESLRDTVPPHLWSTPATKSKTGKIEVWSNAVQVRTIASEHHRLTPDEEILAKYGTETFWKREGKQRPFCAVCFLRLNEGITSDNPNPINRLIRCAGTDKDEKGKITPCSVARHVGCFPAEIRPTSQEYQASVRFFCPSHLPESTTAAAASKGSKSSSKNSMTPPSVVLPRRIRTVGTPQVRSSLQSKEHRSSAKAASPSRSSPRLASRSPSIRASQSASAAQPPTIDDHSTRRRRIIGTPLPARSSIVTQLEELAQSLQRSNLAAPAAVATLSQPGPSTRRIGLRGTPQPRSRVDAIEPLNQPPRRTNVVTSLAAALTESTRAPSPAAYAKSTQYRSGMASSSKSGGRVSVAPSLASASESPAAAAALPPKQAEPDSDPLAGITHPLEKAAMLAALKESLRTAMAAAQKKSLDRRLITAESKVRADRWAVQLLRHAMRKPMASTGVRPQLGDGDCIFHSFTYGCRMEGIASVVRKPYQQPTDGIFDAAIARRDVLTWIRSNLAEFHKILFEQFVDTWTGPPPADKIIAYDGHDRENLVPLNTEALLQTMAIPRRWHFPLDQEEENDVWDHMPLLLARTYGVPVTVIRRAAVFSSSLASKEEKDTYLQYSTKLPQSQTTHPRIFLIHTLDEDHYDSPDYLMSEPAAPPLASSIGVALAAAASASSSIAAAPPVRAISVAHKCQHCQRDTTSCCVSCLEAYYCSNTCQERAGHSCRAAPIPNPALDSSKQQSPQQPMSSESSEPVSATGDYQSDLAACEFTEAEMIQQLELELQLEDSPESDNEDPWARRSEDEEYVPEEEQGKEAESDKSYAAPDSDLYALKSVSFGICDPKSKKVWTDDEYKANFTPLTDAMLELLTEAVKAMKCWALPPDLKARIDAKKKPNGTETAGADSDPPQPAVDSTAPAVSADGGDAAAAAGSESADSAPKSNHNCNSFIPGAKGGSHWHDAHRLAEDFGVYRSCCGAQYAGSIVPFFLQRLQYFAEFVTEESYKDHIKSLARNTISDPSAEKSHWGCRVRTNFKQQSVCWTCYLALTGVARSTFYDWLLQDRTKDERENLKKLKAFGRPPSKADLARAAVLEEAKNRGQMPPNTKGKDLGRQNYVLPHATKKSLHVTVACGGDSKTKPMFSESTMRRAIIDLEQDKKNPTHISCTKTKAMCRCNDCDKFANDIENASAPGMAAHRRHLQNQYLLHLALQDAQRADFNSMKAFSMKYPELAWTIMFDGMDMNKTQLPSRTRYTKDMDALPRIKVHMLGVLCYGAPIAAIGLGHFENISKDSGSTVAVLQKILDMQFEAVMKNGGKWPRRLHLVFDNTTAEAKNRYFFSYLGLLVRYGVFDFITVGNLMVGHTHDVVDQMFSVWSKALRITNAHTWEQMRKLFHEKYNTMVQKISEKWEEVKVWEATSDRPLEDRITDFDNLSVKGMKDLFLKVCKEMNIPEEQFQPDVRELDYSVNIMDFLDQVMDASLLSTDNLNNIAAAHCFGIQRGCVKNGVPDPDDNAIWLYNKHLVGSDTHATEKVHSFPGQPSGNWTTRVKLFDAIPEEEEEDKVDPAEIDPFRAIDQRVDTNVLRKTIQCYVRGGALQPDETEELEALLSRFDQQQARLGQAGCAECQAFVKDLSDVGVIHHGRQESEAEKKKRNQQSSDKNRIKKKFSRHLKEVAMAKEGSALKKQHEHLIASGWWTKWPLRVKNVIAPQYIEQGLINDPNRDPWADHPNRHPDRLPTGATEPPIWPPGEAPADERVDVEWHRDRGNPKAGDIAVMRPAKHQPWEPWYIGEVKEVYAEGVEPEPEPEEEPMEEEMSYEAAAKSSRSRRKELSSTPGSAEQEQRLPPGKRAKFAAAASGNAAPAVAAAATRRGRQQTSVSYAEASSESEADEDEIMMDAAESDESEYSDSEGKKHAEPQSASSPAAAASGANSAEAPVPEVGCKTWVRVHYWDHDVRYDAVGNTMKELDIADEIRQLEKVEISKAKAKAKGKEVEPDINAPIESEEDARSRRRAQAIANIKARPETTRPEWLIKYFKDASYAPIPKNSTDHAWGAKFARIPPAALIVWGRRANILKAASSKKIGRSALREDVIKKVRHDYLQELGAVTKKRVKMLLAEEREQKKAAEKATKQATAKIKTAQEKKRRAEALTQPEAESVAEPETKASGPAQSKVAKSSNGQDASTASRSRPTREAALKSKPIVDSDDLPLSTQLASVAEETEGDDSEEDEEEAKNSSTKPPKKRKAAAAPASEPQAKKSRTSARANSKKN